ncbi:MAG: signal peptidase I [Saprospiraceae bacterium]|nr:signal peptidase I [Saprospiraceae bacterium]MCB0675386.1 signal peptidase I [Saprospiraceae bacterium]MCB0680312.1 signal peptidase I [Saprospiraceae bacterium]
MEILLFLIASYVLLSLSLYKVFEKAGEAGWKGLVPGLNFMVWCKLIGRPSWYAVFLLIPIVNLFIFVGMAIDLVRSFGRHSFLDSALTFFYAPGMFLFLGLSAKEKYEGPALAAEKAFFGEMEEARKNNDQRKLKKLEARNPYRKSFLREWTEAIVFAVFAAAFIRMFLIEAYTIPTSSMEGSLLVGDFLFVSKAHYGIRTPQTVLMIPLLHNRIPVIGGESYLEKPNIPFTRLPALEKIDRNDPVVFNYPEGDSVFVTPGRVYSIYDVRRNPGFLAEVPRRYKLITRPIDKKDHYIKRCVGAPGDSIQVIDRQLYINGQPAQNPTEIQFNYLVTTPSTLNTRRFEEWGISEEDVREKGPNYYILTLSEGQKEKVRSLDPAIQIEPVDMVDFQRRRGIDPYNLFPYDKQKYPNWTVDNYGPLYIPKKGATIPLDPAGLAPYRRIIEVYENNTLEFRDGQAYLNGQPADSYTFQQDYYWMMGDNRHNSEDSRVWGYVPADHVVGKPLFIWFSTNGGLGGIRWNRLFTTANRM